jgi:hypothetical protein
MGVLFLGRFWGLWAVMVRGGGGGGALCVPFESF